MHLYLRRNSLVEVEPKCYSIRMFPKKRTEDPTQIASGPSEDSEQRAHSESQHLIRFRERRKSNARDHQLEKIMLCSASLDETLILSLETARA